MEEEDEQVVEQQKAEAAVAKVVEQPKAQIKETTLQHEFTQDSRGNQASSPAEKQSDSLRP